MKSYPGHHVSVSVSVSVGSEFLNVFSFILQSGRRQSAPIRVSVKGASNTQAGIFIHCSVSTVHRLDPQTQRE